MKRFAPTVLIIFFYLAVLFNSSLAGAQTAVADDLPTRSLVDIVLVLDNSGSMLKNDPEFMTPQVVRNFLSSLSEGARLGMILFDRNARLLEPIQELANSVERAKFLKSLDGLNYRGPLSDSPAAIERALYELKTNGRPDAARIIILLTDGIVDTGDLRKDAEKYHWLKEDLALECQKEKVRIFGVAFTDQADFSLIQALAFKTDGQYYRAFNATEIGAIFTSINEVISRPLPSANSPTAAPVDKAVMPQPAGAPIEPPPSAAQPPAASPETVPDPSQPAGSRRIIYIAAGLSALIGAILFIAVLTRRSKTGLRRPKKGIRMPRAELVDIKNVTSLKTLQINKQIITIGRDSNNTVSIPRDTVSSLHATIEYRDGFYYLEDQRSRNNTFLNGAEVKPYQPRKLKSGDILSFNTFKFIFLLPDSIPAGKTIMDFGGESELTRSRDLAEKEPPPSAVASALPQAMLIDIKNITGRKTVMLDKTITSIGRGVHNDLDIPKPSISGSHATIEYKNGTFFLEDQRSKNTTGLNGKAAEPFSPQKLKSGDEITFDTYKFIFLLEHQTPTGDTEESL